MTTPSLQLALPVAKNIALSSRTEQTRGTSRRTGGSPKRATEHMVAVFGLSGIASGFLAGLFGIGGGLIMVPVLVYAFKTMGMATDHVVTMALGTSMAAIVFSSAQSAYGHSLLQG